MSLRLTCRALIWTGKEGVKIRRNVVTLGKNWGTRESHTKHKVVVGAGTNPVRGVSFRQVGSSGHDLGTRRAGYLRLLPGDNNKEETQN